MNINLTPINKEQERIKEYLENNVSDILADKINNGVRIQKDGITLINKKDLNGFWKYATEQARKISEKGSNGAYVNDDTVFGWAMHYFEEDSIEGTLYNEDGSEFKAQPIKQVKAEYKPVKKPETKPKTQFSLFDFMKEEDGEINRAQSAKQQEPEIQSKPKEPEKKVSTVYRKYLEIQNQYPSYAVAYRLGDFYEIFGDNAVKISNELDLTLTGRDCGIDGRIAMIGFPYHTSEIYFEKISKTHPLVIVDGEKITVYEQEIKVDVETGEIITDEHYAINSQIDKEIMIMLYELLDEKLTVI